MWKVVFRPEVEQERRELPVAEWVALQRAVEKLKVFGPQLPYPHQSAVRGFPGLRELRPRAGRSPWRGLFGRIGEVFVSAAIAPEAQVNRRGFERAARLAEDRLRDTEAESYEDR